MFGLLPPISYWGWTRYFLPFDETTNAIIVMTLAICLGLLQSHPDVFLPPTLPMEHKIELYSDRVVTPDGVIPALVTVYHGRIQRIARMEKKPVRPKTTTTTDDDADGKKKLVDQGETFYDFTGKVIIPGLVDLHVHLNEPGRTEWEGVQSGTRSAAVGGVTTVVDMPLNSIPSTVDVKSFEAKLKAIRKPRGRMFVDVAFWGGLVPQNAHNASILEDLLAHGVVGLKAFMSPAGTEDFDQSSVKDIKAAAASLSKFNAPLMVHAELPSENDVVSTNGKDPRKYSTYMNSRPRKWEKDAIKELIDVAKTNKIPHIHIAHVSDADTLSAIKSAKDGGAKLTAETCPHYLYFNAESIPDGSTLHKCAPPIREEENRQRLWDGLLKDEALDMISSDHSPSPLDLKHVDSGDFIKAWGGISGLQLSLPLTWTKGKERGMTLSQFAELWSTTPARIAGLGSKGSISTGKDADFVVFDPDGTFVVNDEMNPIFHKHNKTAYDGQKLRGVIHATFLRGREIYAKDVKGVRWPAWGQVHLKK
ncbi:unnamed protein product [Bathycoccus prasinos]|mmetsp:Transcript_6287/g.21026  ORF Transcript_6287/g.21026 Transcript_6287/m.21026 type:complete len:534 (+) Transcript_6287:106-1707(+)